MVIAFLAFAEAAGGQRLPIKTELGATNVRGCEGTILHPPSRDGEPPGAESASALRDLVDGAQRAARTGKHGVARDAFRQAAALAPGDPQIAHELGRLHETLKEPGAAVHEYCRYLALSPFAPDRDDVRGRIAALIPAPVSDDLDDGRATFRSGVTLLQRREYEAADSELTQAAQKLPYAPEPLYNRALARAARGMRSAARHDFRRYLQLAGDVADRHAVEEVASHLPVRFDSPSNIFAAGLAFPGLGQFATRRPVLGAIALGAAGGSAAWALRLRPEKPSGLEKLLESNGVVVGGVSPPVRYSRPNIGAGLTYAAMIWVAAAYESFTYAHRSQRRAEAIIAGADGPRGRGVAFVLAPLPGERTGAGLSVAWGGAGSRK